MTTSTQTTFSVPLRRGFWMASMSIQIQNTNSKRPNPKKTGMNSIPSSVPKRLCMEKFLSPNFPSGRRRQLSFRPADEKINNGAQQMQQRHHDNPHHPLVLIEPAVLRGVHEHPDPKRQRQQPQRQEKQQQQNFRTSEKHGEHTFPFVQ